MVKKSNSNRHKPSKRSSVKMQSTVQFDLVKHLLHIPRLLRIVIAGFFALTMAMAIIPFLALFSWIVSNVLRDPTIILDYIFTRNRIVLNFLLFLSVVAGMGFYIVGWRVYVQPVDTSPEIARGMIWWFVSGIASLVVVALWLAMGSYLLAQPY